MYSVIVGVFVSVGVGEGVLVGDGTRVAGVPATATSLIIVRVVVADMGIGGILTIGTIGLNVRLTVTWMRSPRSIYSDGGQVVNVCEMILPGVISVYVVYSITTSEFSTPTTAPIRVAASMIPGQSAYLYVSPVEHR